jgi:glucokinase
MALLGIEIGIERLAWGRVDRDGRVISSRTAKPPAGPEALDTALSYLVASGEQPDGIGVICRTPFDEQAESIEEQLRRALRQVVPVVASSIGPAALAGERAWGSARGCSDAVLLNLETRIDGAVMAGGRLLSSPAAAGPGHITVEPEGAPCGCGNRGCLETVASCPAIEAEARAAAQRGYARLLAGSPGGRGEFSCRAVLDAAAAGDAIAIGIVGRAARGLGLAIAALCLILDPELVVVRGPAVGEGSPLLAQLRANAAWRLRTLRPDIPIEPARVAEHTAIAHAAALTLSRL